MELSTSLGSALAGWPGAQAKVDDARSRVDPLPGLVFLSALCLELSKHLSTWAILQMTAQALAHVGCWSLPAAGDSEYGDMAQGAIDLRLCGKGSEMRW